MQELRREDGIGLLIGAARRRIKQVVWSRLEPFGVTPQQFWVLLVLHEDDGLSLHALADRVWADDPTACRIISKLEQQKLVRAESDPHDRRRFRLRLTAKGRKLGAELAALKAEMKAGVERGLSAADRETLRELLLRVVSNMDRMEAAGTKAGRPRRLRASRA